ncbi:MAG: hypothetical protein U0835_04560 [Isosphaeraceae bacterium]
MSQPDGPRGGAPLSIWFVGDLADPWVSAIGDAVASGSGGVRAPVSFRRVDCPGDLPDTLLDPSSGPDVLVLHRSVLTRHDADRLAFYRTGRPRPPRVVLCHGPHARHRDLEIWANLVDSVVPEATARETIARQIDPPDETDGPLAARPRPQRALPRVAVVSGNAPLRSMLVEVVEAAGYPAEPLRNLDLAARGHGVVVWDVPVLEPGWPEALERCAGASPVIALFGFPDRRMVAEARSRGAVACLELPFDVADLNAVVDRAVAARVSTDLRAEPAHATPPPPVSRRLEPPRVAEPARGS